MTSGFEKDAPVELVECQPYHAKLTASVCVRRYLKVHRAAATVGNVGSAAVERVGTLRTYSLCKKCQAGAHRARECDA